MEIVTVYRIGYYKLPDSIQSRLSSSKKDQICQCCGEFIDKEEIHFIFDGEKYCIGCVGYE